jgi:hypothetical protein
MAYGVWRMAYGLFDPKKFKRPVMLPSRTHTHTGPVFGDNFVRENLSQDWFLLVDSKLLGQKKQKSRADLYNLWLI